MRRNGVAMLSIRHIAIVFLQQWKKEEDYFYL